MNKQPLALVGVGRWGANIRRTLEERLGERVVSFDGPTNPADILRAEPRAILIATPASTHVNVVTPFLERGLPVFIEKPLATNVADAEHIQCLATQHAARVFVGHVHLYNPAYQAAKAALPILGPMRLIWCEGMNNGPYRDDVSAVWDWAPHDVALVLDALGEQPHRVQAWGVATLRPDTTLYDAASIKLDFSKGVVATITVSWLSPQKRKKVTCIGETSSLVFDDTAEKKVAVYQHMGPTVREGRIGHHEPKVTYPAYASVTPLEAELAAFIQMVDTGQATASGIEQGVAVVRVLAAAEKSIASHGAIVTL